MTNFLFFCKLKKHVLRDIQQVKLSSSFTISLVPFIFIVKLLLICNVFQFLGL